jgi:uncharacterized membrane protein YqiK
MNTAFLKIKLLNDLLKTTQAERQRLINEAIIKTNNPVVKMRRFRMLSQLAEYESVAINKIMQLDSDDVYDFIDNVYQSEIYNIVDRSG